MPVTSRNAIHKAANVTAKIKNLAASLTLIARFVAGMARALIFAAGILAQWLIGALAFSAGGDGGRRPPERSFFTVMMSPFLEIARASSQCLCSNQATFFGRDAN